jgi:hypothetical protein
MKTEKWTMSNIRQKPSNALVQVRVSQLKESMINKLMIFERKIMRKILGPTRSDDGYWRIKTTQEISDILKGRNIIGFIKKQRLNWLGHIECKTEDNNGKKIKIWKPMS